jgi:hypothetical protein
VIVLGASALGAQLPDAEAAFARGDYRTARQMYEHVLALDSLNSRALYRLAVLDSWDGKLRESLARFTKLRRVEPLDEDIMVAQARVLSWDGQTLHAEALYDSVLARSPNRTDALAGRARAVAWSGALNRAERLWRDALTHHPNDPEILIGLAQTLDWEGQPALAESYAARAREAAPSDRSAQDLLDQVRAERASVVSGSVDHADDHDHNQFTAVNGSYNASLAGSLRATLHAVWRRNSDPFLSGTSTGFDVTLARTLSGGASLRAGLGTRSLNPSTGASRTPLVALVGIGFRPASFASVGISYNHTPFDETAVLVQKGLVWDAVSTEVELSPRANLSITGIFDAAWLSDHNRRLLGALAVMQGLGQGGGVHVGVYGRIMGYHNSTFGQGYFTPDRFSVGEARLVYGWRRARWGARIDGGLGVQQVTKSAASQSEYHAGATISRGFRAIDELAITGLFTNSAQGRTGTVTTGSYSYWAVGIRYRRGV